MRSAFRFRDRDTPLHRMDPRLKLVAAAVVSTGLVRADGAGLVVVTAAVLLAFRVGRVDVLSCLREVRPLLFIAGFVFLNHAVTTPGVDVLSIGPVAVTVAGVVHGVEVSWRVVLIALTGLLVSSTTDPEVMRRGLDWFLRPLPFGSALSTAFAMAMRLVPSMAEELERVRTAGRSRCVDSAGPVRQLRFTASPVVVRSVKRADRLADAMDNRCYSPDRTTDPLTRPAVMDVAALVAAFTLSGAALVL